MRQGGGVPEASVNPSNRSDAPEIDPFDGADGLLELIQRCYLRPRFGDRREGLPLVCLVRAEADRDLLPAIDASLGGRARRRIPHTYLDLTAADPEADEGVRQLLARIAASLSSGPNSRSKRLRFPRLRLAAWLMKQDLRHDERGDEEEREPDRVLFARLRARDIYQERDEWFADGQIRSRGVPWWLQLALRIIPPVLFFLKVAGRWPFGTRYRWFLRQPYLSPGDPGSFIGFAERLTVGMVGEEDPHEVDLLLVNAFLEDLRSAYRPFPRSVFARRRTTYPMVLLDAITRDNGGYDLLRLINTVRNGTGGRFDPLLMVSASQKVPPDALELAARHEVNQARDALLAYEAWHRRLISARRARERTAWYLPLAVPDATPEAKSPEQRRTTQARLDAMDAMTVPSPPPWSRRWPLVLLALAVVAAGLVGFGRWSAAHCGQVGQAIHGRLRAVGNECVGISAGDYHFGIDGQSRAADRLAAVEQLVYRQNQAAARKHDSAPDRPYYTLVYMGILSSRNDDEALATPLQQVEGVATRQNIALGQSNPEDPLFRVLFANEGKGALQGETVANMVTARARGDRRIIGIVGLDDSRAVTINAIKDLYRAELPVITPTLSYDGLPDISPLYFQVNPGNDREAAIDAAFAKHKLHAKSVQIFSAGNRKDQYSVNLYDDVARHMKALGVRVEKPKSPGEFTLAGRASDGGKHACDRPDSLVYYAGRGSEVEDFLSGMQKGGCGSGKRPYVLADDDVARYVAEPVSRHQTPVPIYYGALAFVQRTTSAQVAFYRELDRLFAGINGNGRTADSNARTADSLDGHAALSYDAADAFAQAVGGRRNIEPGELWRRLRNVDFHGITGRIAFNDDGSERVPPRKQFGILHLNAASLKKPTVVGWCGDAYDPKTQRYGTAGAKPWCGTVDRK